MLDGRPVKKTCFYGIPPLTAAKEEAGPRQTAKKLGYSKELECGACKLRDRHTSGAKEEGNRV